jgi:hypothetical protein
MLTDTQRQHLQTLGADTVRNMLIAGSLPSDWRAPAAIYLAEIDAEERENRAAETKRQSAIANSTKFAAWVAAALAAATLIFELVRAYGLL